MADANTVPTASGVFNHLILSYLVFFFNKSGLFPLFGAGVSVKELLENYQFDPPRLRKILATATALGVLEAQDGLYQLTPLGEDLERNRGFFTWAIGGYSPLLESMDLFLDAPASSWRPYVRGDYVAIGSDEANKEIMQPTIDRVIDELPAKVVADLGCGNAGRLIKLLHRRPDLTGVGIDIDPQAITVAAQNRDRHGLAPRLSLVRENVFSALSSPQPELADVELVMSFMMLHDLFNIKELEGNLFPRLRASFPRAKYFVLADTCLDESIRPGSAAPIFTLGYELIHALRGIQVFPLSHYQNQFAASGFRLLARHDLGVPNTHLFILGA